VETVTLRIVIFFYTQKTVMCCYNKVGQSGTGEDADAYRAYQNGTRPFKLMWELHKVLSGLFDV
jgi:hypothetical protein